jgi:hypothetical protein
MWWATRMFPFAAKKKIIYWKPGDTRRRLCLWLLVWFSYQGENVVLKGSGGPLRGKRPASFLNGKAFVTVRLM